MLEKKNKAQPSKRIHAVAILIKTIVLLLKIRFFGFNRFWTLVLIFPMCFMVADIFCFVKRRYEEFTAWQSADFDIVCFYTSKKVA